MTKQQAIDIIHASSLSKYTDEFSQYLLPSASIKVHVESTEKSTSWFGGLPILSSETEWPRWDDKEYKNSEIARWEKRIKELPRATGLHDIVQSLKAKLNDSPKPLTFLCQLSMSELYSVTPLPGWPVSGTMAFFCDPETWGFDPQVRGHCKVIYVPEGARLIELKTPDDLPEEARFPKRTISFKTEWTLPSRLLPDNVASETWDDDEYQELLAELIPTEEGNETVHRCGGHPQEVQGDMRLECQLVSNGLYCGDSTGYEDPRRAELEKGTGDWQLLLQVDSDEEHMGWMWGDSGRIYFWARQQDIKELDFDHCWSIVQCY